MKSNKHPNTNNISSNQSDSGSATDSRWRIDRRTLLRGAGATLGLPLLEVMTRPNRLIAGAVSNAAPTRMACVFFPNGSIMPDWKPTGEGKQWELSKTLQALKPFQAAIAPNHSQLTNAPRGVYESRSHLALSSSLACP